MLTVAGSRAGKGVSLIVPNLILYNGSAFVIDPKGENAAITAGRRGKGTRKKGAGLGQDVYVLDPFDVSGKRRGRPVSFNPLAELDIDGEDVVEDASMFAEALITHPEKDRHWTESAQALLRALILVALADRDPRRRNLITVRRLLTLTDRRIRDVQYHFKKELDKEIDAQQALIELLYAQKKRRFGYVCVGIAAQLEAMGEKELGSVLSTTKTQTQWLDDPRMKNVLCRSDFDMADLKLKPTTIYLCLPAMRMGTHARWLRLMIFLALTVMERTPEKPKEPVLFVLDEFPVLG
ncbi:MAG: type IV secretory system conjugative DNA transfer family protein, partial [Rhodomicrobium sp.]